MLVVAWRTDTSACRRDWFNNAKWFCSPLLLLLLLLLLLAFLVGLLFAKFTRPDEEAEESNE